MTCILQFKNLNGFARFWEDSKIHAWPYPVHWPSPETLYYWNMTLLTGYPTRKASFYEYALITAIKSFKKLRSRCQLLSTNNTFTGLDVFSRLLGRVYNYLHPPHNKYLCIPLRYMEFAVTQYYQKYGSSFYILFQ